MNRLTAELVFQNPSVLGEGSLWDPIAGLLHWVDICQHQVCVFDPRSASNRVHDVGEDVGTVVLTRNDQLLLARRSGLAVLDPETGNVRRLVDPEADRTNTRFNDGKCDPRGRFWVGTMVEDDQRGGGALYCVDTDLRVSRKVEGVTISNGLVWSRDATRFFHIDTPTYQVVGYDYDAATGEITSPSVVARIPKDVGAPDGMAIDEHDQLWIALFDGGRVIRVDPTTGSIGFEVMVPAGNVTSCAFGGPDLDELYITTARVGLSPEQRSAQPLAGSLFRARVPFRGVPSPRFDRDL